MVNQEAEDLKATGNELVKKKKYAEAVKKYKKASIIDPTNVVYWSNMALCYDKMKDWNKFKEVAQKCIDIDRYFIKGYYRLATAQERLWEFEKAKATIARGLTIDPLNIDLLQKNIELFCEIKKRGSLNKDTLNAHTSNLRFLGGLRQGDKNKIPFDSAYGRLKRSPFPPIAKKHLDLSQYSKHIRPVFESFYTGELQIEWKLDGGNFLINGYVPTDTVPVIYYEGKMSSKGYEYTVGTHQNQKYHRFLTLYQAEYLQIVMFQRFLREKAALLNYDKFLQQLVEAVSGEYCEKKLYKYACDIHLIFTDVCFNRQLDLTPISAVHLAEALESNKQYKEAADIYVEISDAKVFRRHPSCKESLTRGFAALAYKRAQDYVSAEREYIGSLRAVGPNWNIDPHLDTYIDIKNMMSLYQIVNRTVTNGLHVDEAHKNIQKACFLLVGLLSIAGFDGAEEGCALFDDMQVCQRLLKPQYKSRNKALQAIVAATMKPSIDEYHKLLFSYQLESYSITPHFSDPTLNLEEEKNNFVKRQKAGAKSSARKHTQKNNVVLLNICRNCHKQSEDMKECPCHTVRYCGKECQLAHWPSHKKDCPTRKKR